MSTTYPNDPDYITIKDGCRIIGGSKPASVATYHRGVKAARYPAPEHPSPGVSRIRKQKLIEALNRSSNNGNGEARAK